VVAVLCHRHLRGSVVLSREVYVRLLDFLIV